MNVNSGRTLVGTVLLLVATTVPCVCAGDWLSWRGPFQNGSAAADATPPRQWAENQNIAWSADLPGTGSSTPIVVGDRVFVLSAQETERPAEEPVRAHETSKTIPPSVYFRFLVTCLNRQNGQVVWQQVATEQVPHEGHHPTHTYAAGSPASDGRHLFVSFGSRGIFCYSLEGELRWQTDPGNMQTRFGWGEAVTPALAGDLLIVNWDQEEDSFIMALDKHTGHEVWRTDRPGEKTSWNTPLVTSFNNHDLAIVNGSGKARAYDVLTGSEVWSCGGQTTNAIPSAVRFEDFVVVMSGYRGAAAFAIPLDARGDVTDSDAILWQHHQGTPYVPSPLLSGHRLFFTSGNSDVLSCLDVQTGKPLVERRRLSGAVGFYASPLAADGHLFFVGREGTTVVLRDDDSLQLVASNTLEGTFDASPVVVGDQLFLRSWNRVYCLRNDMAEQ